MIVVLEVLDFGAVWICRSMPTFRRNMLSPKRRHRSANSHSAKTQDFYKNMIIIAVRTSNLINRMIN
jgi:hypothetical protein